VNWKLCWILLNRTGFTTLGIGVAFFSAELGKTSTLEINLLNDTRHTSENLELKPNKFLPIGLSPFMKNHL
jgi:hypothetical protein